MSYPQLHSLLKFYFVTDDSAPALSAEDQVRIALEGGATLIQYRNKHFKNADFKEARKIRELCRANQVPFVVNDHLMLAKALGADGIHVGQEDEAPALARRILGPQAIVGVSASTLDELRHTDLTPCDYVGSGPVFATGTKPDAKPVIGLEGLAAMVSLSPLPAVAIGGINAANAADCLRGGAAGVAVISTISRAATPLESALALGRACGVSPRTRLETPWQDEFKLIDEILSAAGASSQAPIFRTPAGDDACRLQSLTTPVISTDTQREGVHFRRSWQSLETIGEKAVEVTLSDLAAAYAAPLALFVNLGMPDDLPGSTAEAIYRGIGKALDRHKAGLGGGNVSKAEVLTLDLFAVGEGREDIFPVREAARPGDILYSTGPLGLARCGMLALEKLDLSWKLLIDRFRLPKARFDAAAVLAANGVQCVMDISDGLAGDAGHIACASGITIELDPKEPARHKELRRFCDTFELSPEETVLRGGEDYELLFTCSEALFEKLRYDLPGSCRVGRCIDFSGTPLLNLPSGLSSFQHGAR